MRDHSAADFQQVDTYQLSAGYVAKVGWNRPLPTIQMSSTKDCKILATEPVSTEMPLSTDKAVVSNLQLLETEISADTRIRKCPNLNPSSGSNPDPHWIGIHRMGDLRTLYRELDLDGDTSVGQIEIQELCQVWGAIESKSLESKVSASKAIVATIGDKDNPNYLPTP